MNFKDFSNSKLEKYQHKDIFNADKTGLFLRQNSNRNLVVDKEKKPLRKFQKKDCNFLCVNMERKKMKPVVVGKSKNPLSFRSKDK